MDWLEQNLDAYRIIAEILNDLRETLRKRLEALHGAEWYRTGLPEGMLSQLVERKEQEKAIDWYESEYQQIMNYALFSDLLAILEHNGQALPQILKLAPTSSLLQARFLELEVMRAKLGRARPISETELSFLGTFHLRFRKAIEEHRQQTSAAAQAPGPSAPPAPPPQTPTQPLPEPQESPGEQLPPGPPAQPPPTPSPSAKEAAPTPRPPEQQPVKPPPPEPEEKTADEEIEQKPVAPTPSSEVAEPGDAEIAQPEEDLTLEAALEGGHHQAVLRELYREVTSIAEGIWIKDVPPPARVWEVVSVSSWYENHFTPLGLRPLSDFYDIIAKVDQRMRAGTSREELQKYLKEVNFAQILLSLRDMFQRNQI